MRLMRQLSNVERKFGNSRTFRVFWKIVGLFEISGTLWIIIHEPSWEIKTLKKV